MIQYSPVAPVTTATAQYLFRVYHSPITFADCSRLEIGATFLPGTPQVWPGFELNFNDYLMSIPATTADIVNTANQLAYAEALLYVNDRIPAVAVWLVEEQIPISDQSPVTILTPWNSLELRRQHDDYAQHFDFYGEPSLPSNGLTFYGPEPAASLHFGFQSYDLTARDPATYIKDAFITLDVARACETGPTRHQWYRGVLGRDDYYFDEKGRIVLTRFGSAYLTRFPWFAATLETMPYTHSGYELDEYGKISVGRVALTQRIANCAVDSALKRRMFIRRKLVLSNIYRHWWYTMNQVSSMLRAIDVRGYSQVREHEIIEPQGAMVPWTQSPHWQAGQIVNAVMNFLNVVAVGCGSNTLAAAMPSFGMWTQEDYFFQVTAYLNSNPWARSYVTAPVAERDDSISFKTFLSMQDLVGSIAAKLLRYAAHIVNLSHYGGHNGAPVAEIYAQQAAAAHNEWSAEWETVQGDLHALFALLFTWHFNFRPYEPSTDPQGGTILKTVQAPYTIWSRFDRFEEAAREGVEAARLDGRISEFVPIFAPPRSWSVVIVNPQAANRFDDLRHQAELNALAAARAAQEARLQAQRDARRDRNRAEMDALQASIAAGGGANPLDPWDWRNYSRKDYWLTPMKSQDLGIFLVNATNTPDEIELLQKLLKFSPRTRSAMRRIEPVISGVADLAYPVRGFRKVMRNPVFRQLIFKVVSRTMEHSQSKINDDLQERLVDFANAQRPPYEPREFWPSSGPPEPEPPAAAPPPAVTPPPFQSTSTNTGGGGGGGGGADRSWGYDDD